MEYLSKILKIESLTPNIKRFIVEKPKDYNFIPGQHTLISINKPELKDNLKVIPLQGTRTSKEASKKRPFSFSSPNNENFLEFIIKIYNERNGITKEFDKLKIKDELILGEPKGKISYKGKGTFIAAGTGISPFISIIKSLDKNERKDNFLIYSNKTKDQIILEEELKEIFKANSGKISINSSQRDDPAGPSGSQIKENLILILTQEKVKGYKNKRIDKEFLKKNIKNFTQKFYLCGPLKLVAELKKNLIELDVKEKNIVSEI